jgi:hypothetical protein
MPTTPRKLLPYVSTAIAAYVAASVVAHPEPAPEPAAVPAVAPAVVVPSGNGASPAEPVSALGPTWGMVGYAPGHIAAVPQPFGYDTVVDGETTKRIFLSFGAQPDVSTAASVFYTATSDDAGQRFLTSEQTPWTALNMVRLDDGSFLSVEFIPDWIDSTHVTIRTWRSTDQGETWTLTQGAYTAPEPMGFLRVWRGPILLSDGTVIVPAYTEYASDTRNASLILQTNDLGATWTLRSTIVEPTTDLGTNEVGLSYTTDGRLIAVMRPDTPQPYHLRQAFSDDDGRTWSAPEVVTGPDGPVGSISPVLTLQPNGMLLLSYGRPDNNLLVSTDGTGTEWDQHEFVFGNAPATSGPARDMGSSGNTGLTTVEANRSIVYYDRCHSNNLCKPYNEQYSIWGAYVDAVTPGSGKIDVATKLRAGTATISGDVAPANPVFPETRLEGAVDGSSERHAAAVLRADAGPPSLVVELDRSYLLDRIGLMLGHDRPYSASIQLSEDGRRWSPPVVRTTGTRDFALRYTDIEPQRARFVRVTGVAGTDTPVTELELYAADLDTFENDPVFGVPRGWTDALNVTTTDVDLGGFESRRSLRLFDNYVDQVAKITRPAPERDRQVATFELGSSEWNYRGQFVFDVVGRNGGSSTVRWHFLLTPGGYPAPGSTGTPAKPTLQAWNGSRWLPVGTLDQPIHPHTWRTVTVDATLDSATVTIGGQSFTTTTTYQAATALAGMSFTSAGTGVTSTTWFLDDVRISGS